MPSSCFLQVSFLSYFPVPEGGGSTFLLNVNRLLLDYMALCPRRLYSSYSQLWEPQTQWRMTTTKLRPNKSLDDPEVVKLCHKFVHFIVLWIMLLLHAHFNFLTSRYNSVGMNCFQLLMYSAIMTCAQYGWTMQYQSVKALHNPSKSKAI
jgi:hypothetical protein